MNNEPSDAGIARLKPVIGDKVLINPLAVETHFQLLKDRLSERLAGAGR